MKKTAIITGSSRGIGAEIAKKLSDENYAVVVNSARDIEQGKLFAQDLKDAIYVEADISKNDGCQHLIGQTLETFGRIDVLVNNAAYNSPFIEHDDFDGLIDEVFTQNFDVNVLAAWRLAKFARPYLSQSDDGNIINISSIAGLQPIGSSIAYSVSKAALNHLTLLLAKAMAPNVRVNAIAPGLIDTGRVGGAAALNIKKLLIEKSLLKRAGKPEEIAETVLYLLKCQYVTGQIIPIEGGTVLS